MPYLDQAIQHHKKLMQIINEFTENLDADLNHINKKMAGHHQSADSYFQGLKSQLSDIGIDFRENMAAVSNDIAVCDGKTNPPRHL